MNKIKKLVVFFLITILVCTTYSAMGNIISFAQDSDGSAKDELVFVKEVIKNEDADCDHTWEYLHEYSTLYGTYTGHLSYFTTYKCSKCDATKEVERKEPCVAGEPERIGEYATCTKAASYFIRTSCTICGTEMFREDINEDAFGHTLKEIPETDTHYAGEKCLVCNEVTVKPKLKATTELGVSESTSEKSKIILQHTHTWDEEREIIETKELYHIYCNYHYEHDEFGRGIAESICGKDFISESFHEAVSEWIDHKTTEHAGNGGCTSYPNIIQEIHTGEYETVHHENENCIIESKENETDPTCTEDGGYDEVLYCTYCEEEVYRNHVVIPENGHTPAVVNGGEKVEPTCTTSGHEDHLYCTTCGKLLPATVLPALGHDFGEWEIRTPATCTKKGIREATCRRCGVTTSEPTPEDPPGHDYQIKEVVAPTCTEWGYTLYECRNCGDSYQADATQPVPHRYAEEVTERTCTTSGYTTYTCMDCGYVTTGSYIAPLNHRNQETVYEDEVAPTCAEEGHYTVVKRCTDCGIEVSRKTITEPKKRHTPVTRKGKEATCTEDGYEEATVCDVCGEILSATTVIPAKGHTWDAGKVTKEATCTQAGIKTFTCTVCGQTKTEPIAMTGHTMTQEKIAPTCTEDGYTLNHCTECDYSYKTNSRAAKGHTVVLLEAKEASCKEEGLTEGSKCAVCGLVLKEQETIPKYEHNWSEPKIRKEATCTKDGVRVSTCYRCKETKTETIPATGHQYEFLAEQEATCQEEGYRLYSCIHCGQDQFITLPTVAHTEEIVKGYPATCETDGLTDGSYCTVCTQVIKEQEKILATGHDWEDWTVLFPANDVTSGTEQRVCRNNGKHTEIRTIPATTHQHSLVKTDGVGATCTKEGRKAYWTCTACENIFADAAGQQTVTPEDLVIPALGHDYEAEVTAPTCTEQGYTTYTCKRDNARYTADYTPAKGHTAGEAVTENRILPTCTENGSQEEVVYCTDCGTELSRQTVVMPATGHNWGDWTITKEATQDSPGSETRICLTDPSHTENRTIPAVSHVHTLAYTEDVPATCETEGRLGYWECTECGRIYADDQGSKELTEADLLIPIVEHTWGEGVVTKDASCTQDGSKTFTCTVCGNTKTETIPASGHEYKEGAVVAPACTEQGYTAYTCDVCGDSYRDQYTEALGHDWGDWVITKEATETEEGLEVRTCGHDPSHTETRAIAKAAHTHDLIHVPAKAATTADEGNMEYWYCRECGTYFKDGAAAEPTDRASVVVAKLSPEADDGQDQTPDKPETDTITAKAVKTVIRLSKTAFVYNGKVQKPVVAVTVDGKKIAQADYTVSYTKGSKLAGTYQVTVSLKGHYSGTASASYTIKPKGTTISKATGAKKAVTVKWKKQTKQTTGYQIQYSTNSKFKSGNKTVTVKGAKKTSAKLTKLKTKKTYYIRIRTFKTVKGKPIYSGWSKVKKVKTK